MKFLNYSIKQKTNLIFGIVFLGVFLGGGLVLWFTYQQRDYELIINIAGRNRMLSQQMGGMLQFINTSEPSIAQKARDEFEKALKWHIESLTVLKNGGRAPGFPSHQLIDPAPASLHIYIQKIELELAEYQRLWQTLAENLPNKKANLAVFQTNYQSLQTLYFKGNLLQKNIDLVNAYSLYTDENYRLLVSILILAVLVCLVMIVVAFFFLRQMLIRPLTNISQVAEMMAHGYLQVKTSHTSADELGKIAKSINILTDNLSKATQFIRRIGEGDFEAKLNLHGFDEDKEGLANALVVMRNRLKMIATQEDKRNWTNQGLALFGDILRDNSADLNNLCQLLITHLVKYLQAQQGGLFLWQSPDGQTAYLELTAAYAYDASRIAQNKIMPEEGLLGQTYSSQKTHYITQIPENYLQIGSGLGNSQARAVLLIPLKHNEIVEGVIEIACFNELDKYQIEFAEKVAENTASVIHNSRIQTKMQVLVEELKLQTEQFFAQEMVMRQHFDDFQLQQEQSEKLINHLQNQILELKS
jgi:HAMP domain-containing protein